MNPLQIELRKRIKAEGCSMREYARKLGLPRSSFARKLAGESDFTLGEVGVISAALGYSTPSELMQVAEANASELPDPSGAGARGESCAALLEGRHVAHDGGESS